MNDMLEEALERMTILDMSYLCKNALKKGQVWMSEYNSGILYDLSDRKDIQEEIEKFEEQSHNFVYHVIIARAKIGEETLEMPTFLFVSKYPEEWESEKENLKHGFTVAYIWNKTMGIRETGDIGVMPIFGGVKRTS